MNKKIACILLLLLLLSSTFLYSCSKKNGSGADDGSGSAAAKDSVPVTSEMVSYDEDDYYRDYKDRNPSYIELNGTSASIKGSGAAVKNGTITISAPGVYVISGNLNSGRIIVDAGDKDTIELVLNNAQINCPDNAPIYVMNAGKAIIALPDGTNNTVSDGEKYAASDNNEPDAAIFSKDNLTLSGTGTLTVNAKYKDGIASRDDLKITGGNITINAADDGLVGRDMFLAKAGVFTIKAGGDGIKSTNDTDDTKGYIALEGGTYNITAGTDGIQAEISMLVTDGSYTISTGGGSINSSDKAGSEPGQWGSWDNSPPKESTGEEAQSAKGLKASSDITISGGTFKIDSSDDAIHSNNSISIKKGDISIASGDDGIHADSSITVADGKINISKSYEGIESSVITFSGGEARIVSIDDGVNVSGGKDGSSVNGRPGQNSFAASPDCNLNINGGYISINAGGDGLDSNGSIYFTKGTAVVSGPTDNGDGAIDYNGTFQMTGGFLIAAGSSGMAEAPSEESTQYSINMFYTNTQQGGTLFHLQDSKGNTIATFAPEKEYQSVVISSPDIKKGESYTIYTGGTSTGTLSDGLYKDGACQNGTKIVGFTISKVVTWMSETGETTARPSAPGGHGGPGGKPGDGQDRPRP